MARQEFTEETLVLKLGQFREADCWVRFFSPSQGVLTGFAFGGLKSRKRFSGCLDPLSRVLFRVAWDRFGRYLTLCEGSLINRFSGLHRNMSRFGMAVNCIKFLEASHIGTENAAAIFRFTCKTLHFLDTEESVPAFLPLLYRARLTCVYGYFPDLSMCACCRRDIKPGDKAYFAPAQGVLTCIKCRTAHRQGYPVSGELALFLDRILQADPEQWPGLSLPEQWNQSILFLLDVYVQAHMGLVWIKGGFRRT
ncbi:MAG: DNA repair protein RecO [Desulfohalobiaceae bacterium]|nr:DNA repair protein RecO [Desulfohalobiaceae bacterium]